MKKVFSDKSQVAHLWANKHQNEARTSTNNFYFYDDSIYSYGSHFRIAKHVRNEAGEAGVLFTTRSYSNTTAKHINTTFMACRNQNIIFCAYPDQYAHKENIEAWVKALEVQAAKLTKAKKPELYLNQITHLTVQAQKYLSFFGLEAPVLLNELFNITNKDQFKQYEESRKELEKKEAARKQKELIKAHKKELTKFLNFEIDKIYTDIKKDY